MLRLLLAVVTLQYVAAAAAAAAAAARVEGLHATHLLHVAPKAMSRMQGAAAALLMARDATTSIHHTAGLGGDGDNAAATTSDVKHICIYLACCIATHLFHVTPEERNQQDG
jgi:hypothetical protein